MARLLESATGATLRPALRLTTPKLAARKRPAPSPLPLSIQADELPPTHCTVCKGENTDPVPKLVRRGAGKRWESRCYHCKVMFGPGGQTSWPVDGVLERLRAVQESGFIMVLRALHLADADGAVLVINMGDIFPVSHTVIDPDQLSGQASGDRTRKLFTLPLQIDRFQTRLFGHEFDAISLERVMAMRRAGEISESFVTCNDKVGHFTPREDLAELIASVFGPRG